MTGTQTATAIFKVMFIMGLMAMVVESMAISENHGIRSYHQEIHTRRSLSKARPTSLPSFNSASVCGGLGPVCPDGVRIECTVGGVVGCICALVQACQPTVSGCTLVTNNSATPCGF